MRNRIRSVLLASVAIMTLVVLVPTAGTAAKLKPKLVVRGLTVESTPSKSTSTKFPSAVIESNGKGRFGLVFKVKNVTRTRPHNRHGRVLDSYHANIFVNDRKVGSETILPIAAGDSTTVHKRYRAGFAGPGIYEVYVCLHGDENCSKTVSFSAIPRRWDVSTFTTGPNSLTGDAPFFAAQSTGMVFDFFGTVNEAGVEYFLWLATGGVSGDITGSDNACTYSGHGAVSHSPWDVIPPDVGYLEISTDLRGYFAEVKDEQHAFIATQDCPGYPPNESEHAISTLETIGLDGRVDQVMSPNATALEGSYTIPTGFGSGSTVGQWSFKAALP